MRPFCIFGAGIVSTSIYTALKDTYHCKPITFLVSEMKNNPTQIDGIPVKIFLSGIHLIKILFILLQFQNLIIL